MSAYSEGHSAMISVITASYNAAATIEALAESLRVQTDPDFEWIVVDGMSTDQTAERVRLYAERYSWVKCISERDFGIYDALNKGIALSQGEHYVVAGADDTFLPDAIAAFRDAIRQSQADVILTSVLKDGVRHGGFLPRRAWLGHQQVFKGSHSLGMAIRKSLHQEYGLYSRRFPMLADGYFLKKLLKSKAVRFYQSQVVTGSFGTAGVSSTNKLQSLAETWQIQMLTEESRLLQLGIFAMKIIIRLPSLLNARSR